MIEAKKIQQLDLNLLKVFECLYHERNMSVVGELLFISPSAVSHAIKRLRGVLGDPLFTRQGQTMQPTSACQRMAPQLLDALERIREILQACGDFDLSSTRQVFKIALHDALEPWILPKLQLALAKQAPHAQLTSIKLSRDDMLRHLSINQIDAAIDIAMPIKKPIRHAELFSDGFCVLLNKSYLSGEAITKQDYLQAQHVAVSNRSSGNVIEDIAFLQQGINRQVSLRCQSYLAAKEVVKSSQLLLTLPIQVAKQLCDDSTVISPVPIKLPAISKHLYWHQNTDQDDALIWFRETITQVFDA